MSRSELKQATLDEVCNLVTDGTHDTPKPILVGYPLIKAKEIVGGRIDFINCDHISEEDHLRVVARSKPEKGDTLFAHIGASLGETAYIGKAIDFSIKNIALFKPNPEIINGRYLYYLILSPQFQDFAKATRTGSAQPFLSLGHLRNHPIRFNDNLSEQRKIAAVLSAYDDLIENNNRRIKILEEMAWLIYREWFVNFHFPGHENIQMVDSPLGDIPEGWEIKEMREVGDVIDCLHSKKPQAVKSGTKTLLQLFNISDNGKMDLTKRFLISDDDYALWTSRIEASPGDCVVTNVGRIAAVAQVPEKAKAALGRNMTAIRAKPDRMGPTFLIQYLLRLPENYQNMLFLASEGAFYLSKTILIR